MGDPLDPLKPVTTSDNIPITLANTTYGLSKLSTTFLI